MCVCGLCVCKDVRHNFIIDITNSCNISILVRGLITNIYRYRTSKFLSTPHLFTSKIKTIESYPFVGKTEFLINVYNYHYPS